MLYFDMIMALLREKLILLYVNNKGADQPAHLCEMSVLFYSLSESVIATLKFQHSSLNITW